MSLTRASRLVAALASLMRDRDGGIGIIFGLSLIPIVGLVGLGVDYGMAITNRARLDRAADASALAAVVTAKAYVAANSSQSGVLDKARAAGVAQAVNTFKVNTGSVPLSSVTLATPAVDISGQTVTAAVTYTAIVQNSFAKLFRVPTTTVTNTSKASADLPSYLDFYLMVDVSGSMGLPTTASGMTQLAKDNKDNYDDYQQGCQFACHYNGFNGWNLAAGKIQLRSDAVNNAVCALLKRAAAPVVPNQYRIGIYPFVNQLATLASLSSDVNTLNTAAQCGMTWPLALTNLLDTGTTQLNSPGDPTTGTGAGGTHFEVALPQMKGIVGLNGFGDGSTSTSRKPFVFLVTDGMQNGQHYYVMSNGKYAYPGNPSKFPGYADAWWDGSQPSQIDAKNCDALKAAGATISVLYIPYNQIVFTNNSGYIAWENNRVNGFSPSLATPLQDCASGPSYFRTANSPADITAALNAMFDQALKLARLTQ
ncbi:Flp pilus assembly protein TadG [Methylobacterium sp. 174MFSha1.1]|uniref:TadE/TadG family type IV pilus assembly protein n=1 Tax=Methylobacterium sp. 174MFSha1.1 TaxID=1502749 RepID=UPI0008F0EDA5|nr:pilus assembly protein TadG-related protein [Methylobacterium sp. 174MFSha1.1]SFV13904.1 Flp pilus assembly protein TadG [Methylobacterium sp. 174MFSha1.1]